MVKFNIGDRIRCRDNKLRTDTFKDIVIDFLNHRQHQYCGKVVLDVCIGKEVSDSTQVGFMTCVPMEDSLRRDWVGRVTLVTTVTLEGEVIWFRPWDGIGGYERGE